MNVTETTRSTRIAVFIDFDNVEIGVKNTIGGQFDIGLVLEAIKERGEIVTKIAYSDWKRVGDYSRLLTQHAIRMVQRNMTPGGDKNGADITMALDALEMCFTHDHINAFVIVGGDSDFISLVEKLKQYGRKVIVVGGRQFTSVTMQRNCHEFIAYENLVGSRGGGRPAERGGRTSPATAASDIGKVLPLVQRALKVLSEREVAPQLGLLKSTLLQLDSTFSEREYGAGSFRDFMEKVAQTGAVTLKQAGRSMLVESREGGDLTVQEPHAERPQEASGEPAVRDEPQPREPSARDRQRDHQPRERRPDPRHAEPRPIADIAGEDEESLPASPMTMQEGIRAVQQAFFEVATPPRFPMYVRQAKQYLRTAIDGFDERQYGFASVVDLLRAAGKEGVVRIERDRQGAVRVFPGSQVTARPIAASTESGVVSEGEQEEISIEAVAVNRTVIAEPVYDAPIFDGETLDEAADEPNFNVPGANVSAPTIGASPRKNTRGRRPVAARGVSKASKAAHVAPEVKPARATHVRKTTRRKSTAGGDN
ncbi:MAG: NYN domain-containing protein [Acidobacteria bacterium]|nr:NYN domain-containing protein [Acidobacteriota bacterium]